MCNIGWSSNEATVACKQLGYYGYINSRKYYGRGSGSIWLKNLNCWGGEDSLFTCPTNKIGNQTILCSHYNDVGVKCYCKCLIMFSCFINDVSASLYFSKRHIFMY